MVDKVIGLLMFAFGILYLKLKVDHFKANENTNWTVYAKSRYYGVAVVMIIFGLCFLTGLFKFPY